MAHCGSVRPPPAPRSPTTHSGPARFSDKQSLAATAAATARTVRQRGQRDGGRSPSALLPVRLCLPPGLALPLMPFPPNLPPRWCGLAIPIHPPPTKPESEQRTAIRAGRQGSLAPFVSAALSPPERREHHHSNRRAEAKATTDPMLSRIGQVHQSNPSGGRGSSPPRTSNPAPIDPSARRRPSHRDTTSIDDRSSQGGPAGTEPSRPADRPPRPYI